MNADSIGRAARVPGSGAARRLEAGFVLAVGVACAALMSRHVREPLFGAHVFRQAHVAGNIEKYVAKGLSLRPETYNADTPGALFDFPAYQLLAAALCRTFDTPPVATARALNVLLFMLALALLGRLLSETGLRGLPRALGLSFFALAPLNLFYWQVPLPDCLAVVASLASLLAYVRWSRLDDARAPANRRVGGRAGAWYALMLAAGVLATLIKNPVYLPFLVGVLWHRLRTRGPRALASPAILAFVGLVGATVVVFKLYSNWVNDSAAFLAPGEAEAYFGPLAERLRRKYWRLIGAAFATEVLAPAAGLMALAGIALLLGRARGRWSALHAGLILGSTASLSVFFNRHREHDYYQLPFVAPLAIAAALASRWLLACAARRCRGGWRGGVRLATASAILGATAWSAVPGVRALYGAPMGEAASRGAWIESHSRPDDFVVYVTGERTDNWDPTHLYLARRDGHNLARALVTRDVIAGLQRLAPGYRRFLVYVPWPSLEEARPKLTELGAQLLAEGDQGSLYQLEPSWLR